MRKYLTITVWTALSIVLFAATHEARSHVLELASVFRARVVDVAPESLTIEITGAEDKIDGLLGDNFARFLGLSRL